MAKKDVQDFRIDFIESVARTDNLKVLRSICGQMERYPYKINTTNTEVLEIVEQGIKRVKVLLGTESKSFQPLQKIKKMSIQSYFEKVAKGYKELEENKKAHERLEKQRNDYKVKISKYRQKGKFDKVKEFEYKLFCVEYPKENLEKIFESMEVLEQKKFQGAVDEYDYKSFRRGFKNFCYNGNN